MEDENENELPPQLCCGLGAPRSPQTIYVGGDSDPTPLIASTMSISPTPPTFTHPNKFAPLDSEDVNKEFKKLVDEFKDWATTVKRKRSKTSKSVAVPKKIDILDTITVRTERELDALLQQHPHLAAIPKSEQKIRKLLRSMPAELICGPDETLCLVESGSAINAAWTEKHFPAYAKLVKPTVASEAGDFATTAGGQRLFNKGRCTVHATVNGRPFDVAFKDTETELPILSDRKIIRKGHDVRFRRLGSTIRNHSTGRALRFHEHQGVYFTKVEGQQSQCTW